MTRAVGRAMVAAESVDVPRSGDLVGPIRSYRDAFPSAFAG